MLNKKYKLYSSILALCMTLALMATGVWAILQQSLGVSTTVTFTATSVKGTINGEVEGGYDGVETDYGTTAQGGSPELTGAEIVQFGTKYVFANITGTNSSWNGKEAYYINGATTEKVKVGAVTSSATIASAPTKSYTVSNKSYVSNFSPTSSATNWSIAPMTFEPNLEGQTSAITLTLTIENTGSNVIAVSFPDDLGQWSDSMSEATASNDNLLVSYATSNNGSAFSEPVAFSTINSKSIVSGGITTIKLVVTVQDDSSSITEPLDLAFQVKLEKGAEVWGGGSAIPISLGTGTEADPYLIETAEQLAYLASGTNDGTLVTLGKYFKQTQPIVLNNYSQIFDTASNTVLVKNNTGTLCSLGLIDYDMGVVKSGTIPNDLNAWTPIGNSTHKFQGTFDGNGYEISGMYINTYPSRDTYIYQGLFGYSDSANIKNMGIVNSYVNSARNVGGVVGYITAGTVYNCYNTSTVTGSGDTLSRDVGGVVGGSANNVTISYCYNTGTISCSGDTNFGGVVGSANGTSGIVNNCYNSGNVYGDYYVGGVAGYVQNGIINCYNTGNITGVSVGGVLAVSDNFVKNCYNTGNVTCTGDYGGGIIYNVANYVSNCYNLGTVTGGSVGSLAGYNYSGVISDCYYLSGTATTAIGVNEVDASYTNIGSLTSPSANIVYITDSDGTTTNPSTTKLLISALNSWVTANQTTPAFRTWTLVGSTNGYPIFA